ncbi:MAG: hypothetical protein K8L99_28835 [Anaerolineae bacterium]|nr:hypothetical protein [Anaerolineae bacterium]
MSIAEYLLIGHVTADLTATGRHLGGTVSYAARTAHAFGLPVKLLTSAAANEPLLEQLTPYVSEQVVLPAEDTSTFENIYGDLGRTQFIRGVASSITANDVPPGWEQTRLVHLAPLTNEVDPEIVYHFPHSLKLVTAQGWFRQWDEQGRVHFRRWFDPDVLRAVDIVVFSVEDVAEAPELEAMMAQAVKCLVVTRGDQGGTYYWHGEPHHYDTYEVPQYDPTGAGDVFAASFLVSMFLLNENPGLAASVAARLAANSVTRVGLEGTPTAHEVEQTLEKVRP